MSVTWQARLWVAQRASAGVLAVCVLVHLATMIVALRGGLDAAEILARVRGSGWAVAFYTVFVLAAVVHAPIGLARVCEEWLGWRHASLWWALAALAVAMLVLGLRAVAGLTGFGGWAAGAAAAALGAGSWA